MLGKGKWRWRDRTVPPAPFSLSKRLACSCCIPIYGYMNNRGEGVSSPLLIFVGTNIAGVMLRTLDATLVGGDVTRSGGNSVNGRAPPQECDGRSRASIVARLRIEMQAGVAIPWKIRPVFVGGVIELHT